MTLGLIYLIVLVVAILCGFLGRNKPNSKLTIIAGVVMIAACVYASIEYTWFHVLGFVGITIVGLNAFGAIELIKKSNDEKKEREDKIFNIDDDEA